LGEKRFTLFTRGWAVSAPKTRIPLLDEKKKKVNKNFISDNKRGRRRGGSRTLRVGRQFQIEREHGFFT